MFGNIYKWSRGNGGKIECEAKSAVEAAQLMGLQEGDWFFQHLGEDAGLAHVVENNINCPKS